MKNQISSYFFSHVVFQAIIYFLLINISYSAPINSSVTYANFLKEIKRDNCMFPHQVKLPFNSSATFFEYLEVHIKICTPSAEKELKRSKEAITLCSGIFNTLKNITCHPDAKIQLPEIIVEFSKNVCANISSLKFPNQTETLLKHLNDKIICDMMCDDEFNPACQVLLWSYQVQQQINSAAVEQNKNEEKEAVDNKGAAVEQNKNEEKEAVDNKESANVEGVQKEGIAEVANKGVADIKNKVDEAVANKEDEAPANKEPDEKIGKSNNPVPNNNTVYNQENLNNAIVEAMGNGVKDQSEKINVPAELPVVSVNNKENQEKTDLPNKEKDATQQISPSVNKIKIDKVDQNEVNVDESPAKSNLVQTENVKKTTISNKTKPSDANENKVPVKAGLVNEAEFKSQKPTTIRQSPDTAMNKVEEKTKPQTVANIETSSAAKIVSETKDLRVMPEKAKDAKVSNLKTEEEKSVGEVDVANQNIISESATGETNNVEDMSPITTVADLEKMEDGNEIPEPSDKNQEPYNDMESEGDYSKLDYDDADDGFYDSSKSKKTDLAEDSKMPVVESQNDLPKFDVYEERNSIGRGVEDIQVIPAFPEQEDSHFFFYFLSIVLLLMGGYLLFHNKQKIIALIVEGRHERRRRSHGVGYKKLETK